MRNVMITTMDEDYVLVAAGQGPAEGRVVWYAARNAILPSVSGFSLAIGFVVSGALLTEIVFSYPGLGFILLNAVLERRLRAAPGGLPGHHLRRAGWRTWSPTSSTCSSIRAPGRRPERWPSAAARHLGTAQAGEDGPTPGRARGRPVAATAALLAQGADRAGHADPVRRSGRDRAVVAPYNPARSSPPRPASRSRRRRAHWLGTTQQQQDVLSQLLVGGRSTVLIAFVAGAGRHRAVGRGRRDGRLRRRPVRRPAVDAGQHLPGACPALPLLIVIFGFLPPPRAATTC